MIASAKASNHLITDEQVRRFVEEGFLVIPGLVACADLDRIKADLVTLATGGYPCPSLKALPQATTADQVLRRILCIHQPHHLSPVMREFVTHPGICAVLSRITGAHLPFWDGAVKCMQSMLFVKPPGLPGQAWHQDERYIPTRDRSLIGAWIALDDATVENGCLRVLPGSHRQGYLYPTRAHHDTAEFDFADESHGFDERHEVPVEVQAGAVVFFNGYLLHRSKRNRSQTYRRALVNHYMNAWSLLPWYDTKEHGNVGLADSRAVICVSGDDPYAWKGYAQTENTVSLRAYDQEKSG